MSRQEDIKSAVRKVLEFVPTSSVQGNLGSARKLVWFRAVDCATGPVQFLGPAPRLQLLCHPGKLASLGRDPLTLELQAIPKHFFPVALLSATQVGKARHQERQLEHPDHNRLLTRGDHPPSLSSSSLLSLSRSLCLALRGSYTKVTRGSSAALASSWCQLSQLEAGRVVGQLIKPRW